GVSAALDEPPRQVDLPPARRRAGMPHALDHVREPGPGPSARRGVEDPGVTPGSAAGLAPVEPAEGVELAADQLAGTLARPLRGVRARAAVGEPGPADAPERRAGVRAGTHGPPVLAPIGGSRVGAGRNATVARPAVRTSGAAIG